jgi:hypothetical protein
MVLKFMPYAFYANTYLKVNKAPGVDEIVSRILIENADYLSQPLECIYREG